MIQPISNIASDEPRASYMRVEKKGSPTVRQLIEAARGLHPGPKKVLAEICNLHEEGGRECYDANNNHLAKKLGMTVPMVSRHIHSLAERGLILLSPKKNGQKRTLTPDASLQAAYRSGESGKITEVVKSILESGKITSFEDESGKKEFTEVVNKNYQTGKHNRSIIKEEELLTKLAALENLVATLQAELQAANAACEARTAEVLDLASQLKKALSKKTVAPDDPMKGKGALIQKCYIDWYTKRNGIEPKLKFGADQKAAKEIFSYLHGQSHDKSDEGVTNAFTFILQKWDTLSSFLRENIDLCQINSNLNKIINHLKTPVNHVNIQQQSIRNQQLGLVDTSKSAAAAARRKELGLD